MKKKIVKNIKVVVDKCTGCRSCEMACSAFHSVPIYSSLNPARSRIRIFVDELRDVYVPIRGGHYAQTECDGRTQYKINGKIYSECTLCPASCPSRDWFKEPDSALPLKCDMCEAIPPLPEPMCVQMCKFEALTYEEREEDVVEEKVLSEEIETGLEALTNKYGLEKILDSLAGISKKNDQ